MTPTPDRTKGVKFSSYVNIGVYKVLVPLTEDSHLWGFISPFPLEGAVKNF